MLIKSTCLALIWRHDLTDWCIGGRTGTVPPILSCLLLNNAVMSWILVIVRMPHWICNGYRITIAFITIATAFQAGYSKPQGFISINTCKDSENLLIKAIEGNSLFPWFINTNCGKLFPHSFENFIEILEKFLEILEKIFFASLHFPTLNVMEARITMMGEIPHLSLVTC